MSKKKRPNKVLVPAPQPAVLHGDVFHAFVNEARQIGNEVAARRVFETDVAEYLKQKDLLDEFVKWRDARRATKA